MSADNNHETGTAPVSLPPEYIAIRLILAIAEAEEQEAIKLLRTHDNPPPPLPHYE